jgi:hypothetical protein
MPNMNDDEVENLGLVPKDDLHWTVSGLPPHLQAEIHGGQRKYQFLLTRTKDLQKYTQSQFSGTPEMALEALKGLLSWKPVK